MQWQIGGNFEPVFMICEIDWKACPAAIATYIWTEVVTDVLDCIANDIWFIWRIVAIISITILILRIIYRKLKCVDEVVQNKKSLNKVSCKIQDLELKMNILTYKMQYGTWPMPHQVRGLNAKKQLRNIRLTLSNYDDRNVWIKRMLLSPPSISCTSCSNIDTYIQRLNEVFNMNNIQCNIKSERSESTDSNTKSTRSSSSSSRSLQYGFMYKQIKNPRLLHEVLLSFYNLHAKLKRWRRIVRNSDIIKMREERQSRSEKFLLRYHDAEALRVKSKNMLPEHCHKYLENMDDCKKFLQELKNSNQSLGLTRDSTETNDSNTNCNIEQKVLQADKTSQESSTDNDEVGEEIVNVVKPVNEKSKCLNEAGYSNENNLNISNMDTSLPKSMNQTSQPIRTNTISRCKQTNNLKQPKILRSSQHTLRLVHKKLESLHNLLQKYNSTGSIRHSKEKKKPHTRESFQSFVSNFNTNNVEEDQIKKIFRDNLQGNNLTHRNKSRKNKITLRRGGKGNEVLFCKLKQDIRSYDCPEQSSLTSEFTFEESEGNKSADTNSENSFLTLQSHSDTVVYGNEKYHRAIEFSASDLTPAKHTISCSDISTNISNTRKRQSDSCEKMGEFVKDKRCKKSKNKFAVREEISTLSVSHQSNQSEYQTFKSIRSSDNEMNEICLAVIESQREFEPKLLDVITEKSPDTLTAKRSRAFDSLKQNKDDEKTLESRNSVSTTTGKQQIPSNLNNLNYRPLNSSSEYFSTSNLMENNEFDDVRRPLQIVKCPSSSDIATSEAEFNSRFVMEEIEKNNELSEEWEQFSVESDNIENETRDETSDAHNIIIETSKMDDRDTEFLAEKIVSQEFVESGQQSGEEPYITDQDTTNEILTGSSETKNAKKMTVTSGAKSSEVSQTSGSYMTNSTSMNMKENLAVSVKQLPETSRKNYNHMRQRSVVKNIDSLVGQRVNDVRYLTQLFSQSQRDAIMEIQKEMQYECERKSRASTEDTESSSDGNSKTAILNYDESHEERSTGNESSLEEENVYDNNQILFLSQQPSTRDERQNERLISLTQINQDQSEGTSITILKHNLPKSNMRTITNSLMAQKLVLNPQEMQTDPPFSVISSVTDGTELHPKIISQQSSSYFINSHSISSKKLSKITIFNNDLRDNITTTKHLKKTDTPQLINTAEYSMETAGSETVDSRVESMENVDHIYSASESSVNFSSDTSTSYIDANSTSSVFNNPTINLLRPMQSSEKNMLTSSLQGTPVEKNLNIIKRNLPSSKYIKPTGVNDKFQAQKLETSGSMNTQRLKNTPNPEMKGRSNSCFVESKAKYPSKVLSRVSSGVSSNAMENSIEFRRTSSRSKIADKIDSSLKCYYDAVTRSVGHRNKSVDSIKSDTQSRVWTQETKVSSRSCIPILKTRLTKEGRPKSPARSALTMTMLWTVNSAFEDQDSSEKIVKAEGRSNKLKPEADTVDTKEVAGEESKTTTLTDKHFVLMPDAKSMLYMQIFANPDRSLIRIVDPKTFLGYLRDRELKIQNVVHEDHSESLICRKNSFLTIIEQASDLKSKFLAIGPAAADEDDLDGNGGEGICFARGGAWMDFGPISMRQREIFVTAKPSVIHTSTSITDLRDECEENTEKVPQKTRANKISIKSTRPKTTNELIIP